MRIRFVYGSRWRISFSFNEAVVNNASCPEDEESLLSQKNRKDKGQNEQLTSKTFRFMSIMDDGELITEFGEDGWYQLEDEIYRRYRFTPMKIEIEEHHVGVYKSKKDNHFKKAEHPAYLLRNSLVSPTLLSGIWNAKYVKCSSAIPSGTEFQRMGVHCWP